MDKPLRLKLKKRYFLTRPAHVVNVCFIVVLFFSTLLIWREINVLEEAYVANQRNNLANVAHEMDGLLQFNIDRMMFFRHGMQSALERPLDVDVLHEASQRYLNQRHQEIWRVALPNRRTLPVFGVSESVVREHPLLLPDDPLVVNELMATLELGYLLNLTQHDRDFAERMQYISRSGFFTSTLPLRDESQVKTHYSRAISALWFTRQTQRNNPYRGVIWQTFPDDDPQLEEQVVTASAPGNVLTLLSPREQELLSRAFAHDNQGGLRLLTRYISWAKLRNFDGVLLRIHTLREGVRGNFGTITIALTLMWILFTLMLLLSWLVIRRMVRNMSVLQTSLEWQAWHDALTRLLNRGALFEKAMALASACLRSGLPLAVIQLDLDHFKSINDRYGHQAGDRVLSMVASTLAGTVREGDLLGRVGGEEFCVVLPNTTLQEAAAIAERLRLRIHGREVFLHNNVTLRVSASLGVSASEEQGEYHFEALQSVADGRLYLAKQNGRNQVCFRSEA
ncbi:cellulose biosynthesis regulator diguanylate cyclase DgcQ [Klebsiella quasipneumoniae]|uniref:cellulose biosynthesis regulator diguanylate cyclase DgcQ n=1 Tax=Klebsiella quasipneumoniae TaxID=1463165 RepID=UPI000DE6FFCE|nr:cellulose biosynthesis regulator diguanylate cyclase DgcQ [Klebsiella quasipneumoniae]SSI00431.1 diguanylate cyclase [Klebsiella quasipneumoniae]